MRVNVLKKVLPVGLILAVWLGLFAGEWWMRIDRFRWHERLILKPVAAQAEVRGPHAPNQRVVIPAWRGGDLTRIAAVDEVKHLYGEEKPASSLVTDEYGYRNEPPTDGRIYPVLVAGDSFLDVQYGDDGNFARMLSAALGQPVYNHAYPGAGAFWGLHRFVLEGRFRERPPNIIVWGLLERELGGELFAGYVYQIQRIQDASGSHGQAVASGIDWKQLRPDKLDTSLPDTSIAAASARRLWNTGRYRLFGAVSEDVTISLPDEQGRHYLFYRYNLAALGWTKKERNPWQIGEMIGHIQDYLRQEGSELIVMLIPDKEQVYRDLIPAAGELPASTLFDVESELEVRAIPVVNLLPAFLSARAEGTPLYWRDDTHWRPEAMSIAAELMAKAIGDNRR